MSLEKAFTTYAPDADTGSHVQLPCAPVVFTTQTETRDQLIALTRGAERQLAIWAVDLDTGLLENAAFLEALKRFVLARRNTRVRILTRQLPTSSDHKHALLVMAERLPASFEIRTVDHPALDASELFIGDDRSVLYRIHAHRWEGMADLNAPLVAKLYLAQFDTAWRAAQTTTITDSTTPSSPDI